MVLSHFLSHPLRLTLSTLKLVCAVHLLQTHLLQISPTAGPSMLPTFSVDGDWIIADMRHARNRLALSSTSSRESSSNGKLEGGFNSNDDKEEKGLKIGDLILYKIPISQTNSGIKRLVGLPGDYVSIGTPGDIGEERMIQIPQGHCWIVGDNLTASRDSRHFGPLPLALIKGKVIAKILPWAERGWYENTLQTIDQ